MEYSRHLATTRKQIVDNYFDHIEEEPWLDYETLFKVSFALEEQILHERHIWFIQDAEETRPHKRLLSTTTTSSDVNLPQINIKILFMLDLFSFMGIAWFVLTKLIFGPLSYLIVKDTFQADVEKKALYCAYDDRLVYIRDQVQMVKEPIIQIEPKYFSSGSSQSNKRERDSQCETIMKSKKKKMKKKNNNLKSEQ